MSASKSLAAKLTDKHFIDWESDTFGYGYGTGEAVIIPALKRFFETLENSRQYDYRRMETEFGPLATWLLINTLGHADVITYGTSARSGWITRRGESLRDYMAAKSAEELYEICGSVDQDYVHCCWDHCNCDTPCRNPMFGNNQGWA